MTRASTTTGLQERIDAYWDARAGEYDAHQHRDDRAEVDRELWSAVWSRALPAPPATVLDLGTGSGHAAFVLAGLGHDVTGMDSSTGMIDIARDHAARTKGDPPTFVLGDACAPELPAGAFDAVTSRYLMWTLREPVTALRRWRDLLRPGGVLALVDSTWFHEGVDGSPQAFVDSYAGLMDELPLAWASSIESTAETVAEAGFTEVTTTPLTDVLDADRRLGVAPGHRPRLQYLVRAVA